MVRLKHVRVWMANCIDLPSQFHYGSIKTLLLDKNERFVISLNSTMVRLKP